MSGNYIAVRRGITKEEDLRRHDLLPSEVRRVYQLAPVEIGCCSPADVKKAGGPKVARRLAIAHAARFALQQCRKAYGPDHPCIERLRAILDKATAPSTARGA